MKLIGQRRFAPDREERFMQIRESRRSWAGSNEAIRQSRHGAGSRKIDKLLKIAVVSFERDSGALKCLT